MADHGKHKKAKPPVSEQVEDDAIKTYGAFGAMRSSQRRVLTNKERADFFKGKKGEAKKASSELPLVGPKTMTECWRKSLKCYSFLQQIRHSDITGLHGRAIILQSTRNL